MGKLRDMAGKLRQVKAKDVERQVLDIIAAEQEQVVDLNRAQLLDSRDSEGEPLGEYASIEYANKKGRADIDLKLTGAFHESIFIITQKFPILFGAKDKKAPELLERYSRDVLGTDKKNTATVAKEIVRPGFIGWFRDLIRV